MSNSLPRTMRRNAAISGSTSSNANSNVLGLTVPSFSARLLPCVRVTVLSLGSGIGSMVGCSHPRKSGEPSISRPLGNGFPLSRERRCSSEPRNLMRDRLHGRLRHAGTRGKRLFGGILERLIRREHNRGGAHLVVSRIDTGRHDAFVGQSLGRPKQAMARHDDAVVGGPEILFGTVADRPHALLERGVLNCESGNAAEGVTGLLSGAVDQIVVVLVGERPISPGNVLAVHARAVAHGLDLAGAEGANGVEVIAPGPAVLVVDRDP